MLLLPISLQVETARASMSHANEKARDWRGPFVLIAIFQIWAEPTDSYSDLFVFLRSSQSLASFWRSKCFSKSLIENGEIPGRYRVPLVNA